MKKLLIIIIFILVSCEHRLSLEEKYEITYGLQIEENNKIDKILLENIKNKISESKDFEINHKLNIYDSLSNEYYNYLTVIEKEIKLKGDDLFFKNDKQSKKGIEFVLKSKKYKSEIEKLIISENLKKRINFIFGMNDVVNKDNYSLNYLDYYFKGFPKIQSSSYINGKKRSVLEFENEFIDEMLIKNIK